MITNINDRVNISKEESSKKKDKQARGITASPFPGLSITSSTRFRLLFIGQMVLVLPAFAFV